MRQFINIALGLFEAEGSPHGVQGLPHDVRFSNRQLQQAIDRNGRSVFRAVARPAGKPDHYKVSLQPADMSKATPYRIRRRRDTMGYYDPELADIETFDKGDDILEFNVPRAKPHLSTEVTDLDEADVIYRGMSAEEYRTFLDTGRIASVGDYNLPGQEGLTYWSTDPQQAQSYANSFAPMQWKPTFGHPCFIVAARKPDAGDIRHVRGTGETEVGVTRPISDDEVLAVWEGRVFDHTPDDYELAPVTSYDHVDRAVRDDDSHRVRYGGYSAQVVWQRIR
jgi:hypothetical protein